ncbi:MAG TPA: MFS transporter [Patescibacteria group bacterium]|nr:MFS transporter [Patescibacteria group bacterium]
MAGSIITDFGIEMAFTYYPLYVKALGGTEATVGLLGSTRGIISALTRFPGGYIADKYGRKQILWSMTLLTAFSLLLYAFAPNWQIILLGVIINGLASIYGPAFDAMIMDSVPSENRGTGYSIIQLLNNSSTTPAPLVAGFLYASFGLVRGTRICFMFLSFTYFIAAFLRYRIKETMVDAERLDRGKLLNSLSGTKVFVEGIDVWRRVPRTVLALLIVEIMFAFPNSLNISMVFYLTEDLGITLESLAVIYSVVSLTILLFAVPCGKLVDKVGRKIPILVGFMSIALLNTLIIEADYTTVLVIRPIIAVAYIMIGSAKSSLFADHTPQGDRGKVAGSRDFFLLVTTSIGAIVGGHIYDTISHTLSIYILTGSAVLLFFVTLFFIDEPRKKEFPNR